MSMLVSLRYRRGFLMSIIARAAISSHNTRLKAVQLSRGCNSLNLQNERLWRKISIALKLLKSRSDKSLVLFLNR